MQPARSVDREDDLVVIDCWEYTCCLEQAASAAGDIC